MNKEILIKKCDECECESFQIVMNSKLRAIVFMCQECGTHHYYEELIKEL